MEDRPFDRRRQGNLGEISAIEWLTWKGAVVFAPVGHSPDVDLIADFGEGPIRVEVKTCLRRGTGNWAVMIATMGGNQSWTGTVKTFERTRCEYLFIHVGDGRRWFIPTEHLQAKRNIRLGGEKYSEFEIEPGRPLIEARPLQSRPPLGECQSGQMDQAVNLTSHDYGGSNPPSPIARDISTFKPVRWERKLGRVGETRISPKRQITMPLAVAQESGIYAGDRLRARSDGDGRVVLERIDRPAQPELSPLAGSAPGEAA